MFYLRRKGCFKAALKTEPLQLLCLISDAQVDSRLLKKLKDVRGQGVLEVFLRFHHIVRPHQTIQ